MPHRSDPSPADQRDDAVQRHLQLAGAQTIQPLDDPFLNTDDACRYLGVPKATLLTWRVRRPGYGPRAVKAGGRLKYRLSELDRWVRAHEESFNRVDEGSTPPPRPNDTVRTRSRSSRVRSATPRSTTSDGIA